LLFLSFSCVVAFHLPSFSPLLYVVRFQDPDQPPDQTDSRFWKRLAACLSRPRLPGLDLQCIVIACAQSMASALIQALPACAMLAFASQVDIVVNVTNAITTVQTCLHQLSLSSNPLQSFLSDARCSTATLHISLVVKKAATVLDVLPRLSCPTLFTHTTDTAHVPRLLASTRQHESASCRWYWASGITTEEAYIFACYDSRTDGVHASPLTQPSRTPPPPLMRLHAKALRSELWFSGKMAL